MEHRRIQQLPPSLVNRIAAGEVIERPASVVKELVENSIDAGATSIVIEVEDGGRELIRIIDDGRGIAAEDLPLAFASHATSKLSSDEDLFNIHTMGFRGEALASVGSVSHARILTRTGDSDHAYEVQNHGGAISTPQAAAGNAGTTIEVRNLFFNVPARRKFLKGTQTEYGHIAEMVLRLALPHPNVSFKLRHNNRTTLDLPATTAEERILQAWPDDFREQRLPIETRDAELRLRGIIGLPELARPTAKHQYLYLNGRHIRDRFIQHALREAYRGLTEPGRHPAAVLLIEIPPQDVDVNVHPTKSEVRFRDGGRIHGLVLSSIREKLLGSDLTPSAIPMRAGDEDQPRPDLREKLASFFRAIPPEALQSAPTASPAEQWSLHTPPTQQRIPISETSQHGGATPASPSSAPPANAMGGRSDPADAIADPQLERSDSSPPAGRPDLAPLPKSALQLHNSYLVTQSEDGLIIIDQHALHERIMYEDLLARLSRGTLESQRLLIPETLPGSSSQIALLDHIQPLLARLGIEVSSFGPGTLAVHAFPSFLEKLGPAQFVADLLERGEQELLDLTEEELLHEILDMMACKAAIKAGDPLTPQEIEALLARKELVERSSNCPHGRPTTLRLTLRDLEKQFKRTGF
ncbi:MAG TPA: DNA mismatch repair endonuclease MutL [Tepidisphaeraceae bacterium]